MTTTEPVHKVVLDNWGVFRTMGWKSPTGAIKHYKAHPEDFEMDLAELRAANAVDRRRTEPANDCPRTRTQSNFFGDCKISRHWPGGGYTPEEIQEMVPDFIDGSGWSLESIRKIS